MIGLKSILECLPAKKEEPELVKIGKADNREDLIYLQKLLLNMNLEKKMSKVVLQWQTDYSMLAMFKLMLMV